MKSEFKNTKFKTKHTPCEKLKESHESFMTNHIFQIKLNMNPILNPSTQPIVNVFRDPTTKSFLLKPRVSPFNFKNQTKKQMRKPKNLDQ